MGKNDKDRPKTKGYSSNRVSESVKVEFSDGLAFHQNGLLAQAQAIYEQILQSQPRHFDALHLLGVIAYQSKNAGLAAELIAKAIKVNPKSAAAYLNYGNVLSELKHYATALQSYGKAIALKPDFADAYNNRGAALNELNRHDEALQNYKKALSLNPSYAEAYFNRGVSLVELKRYDEALQSYDKAISLKADYAEAYNNRGITFMALNQPSAALQSYDKAIALKQVYPIAYNNRGVALKELNQLDVALQNFEAAIRQNPDYADAYYSRGNALSELKRYDEALQCYERVIALNPDFVDAYYNRGFVLNELNQRDVALQSYDQAILLKPDYADAYNNRGNMLKELKQYDAALKNYDMAITLNPGFAEPYYNRANLLNELGHHEAALLSYDQAIDLKPDDADPNFSRSMCHLLLGHFDAGWAQYEWRWKDESLAKYARQFSEPLWFGLENLRGKSILLYSEQGFGDTLQFCRYAQLVSELGARVVLEVQRPLLGLLTGLKGVAEIIAKGDQLPVFDYQCPLLSMPLAFNTVLESIPAFDAYLAADSGKIEEWRARLGVQSKPRVGLVWSGSTEHKNDRNRSILLSDLVKFLPDGIEYVCLQKDIREVDKGALEDRPDIAHYSENICDFADTAALCELVDIVISVDTSVAHLAGALGKPVWVLLPSLPDWRWLLDRNDSPWYPSARLYRQEAIEEWNGVLNRLEDDLLARIADHKEGATPP